MTLFSRIISELKSRNVRKTMAIYFSSALTVIGVIRLLIDVYDVPKVLFPVSVTLLLSGLVSAFIFAWFHGKEGGQRFGKREVGLHILVFTAAAFISFRVAGAPTREFPLHHLGKSIAVLPFENLSDSKQDEYFSDGITEDILTQLSKIGALSVISRTSAMKYKNSKAPLNEIADELGVGTLLTGSVRHVANRVRIDGKLYDASNEQILWANTYDRDMKDIFAIQSDVAQRIAVELSAKLSPSEQHQIEREPTKNLDAYAYYLRGREYYYHYTKEDNELAIGFFKQATALDSGYAAAYAGLADAYSQRYQQFDFPRAWVDSAIALSKKGISIDPNQAEPYKALGLAYMKHGMYNEALENDEKAIQLNPNYAGAIYNAGLVSTWLGKLDQAVAYIEKSIQLEPAKASRYEALALAYMGLTEDSLAEQYFERSLRLEPRVISYGGLLQLYMLRGEFHSALAVGDSGLRHFPDEPSILVNAAEVEILAHDYTKAKAYLERLLHQLPDESNPKMLWGFARMQMGESNAGKALLEEAATICLKRIETENEEGDDYFELARNYAAQGKPDEAKERLRAAVSHGWRVYRWAQLDPMMASLHNDAEFKGIISTLKDNVERMRRLVHDKKSAEKQMSAQN